jgi:hypothetical protein
LRHSPSFMKNSPSLKKSKNTFTFLAPLATIEGNYVEHGIFLPSELVAQLPAKRLRVKGTINGVAFALAIQYRKSGDRFFMINKKLVKEASLKLGSKAQVNFRLVDPDLVEVPEELEAVLEQDELASSVWATFPNGLRRSLIHYVTSAKSIDVRIKRSLELMEKAKLGLLYIQHSKKKIKKSDKD